jgi:PAS domain S-box-containing protein
MINLDELRQLHSDIEKLRTIIHFSSDGLFVVDHNGIVLEVNKAYEEMTGISKEEVLGENISDLVLNEFFDRSAASMALQSKKKTTIIQQIKKLKFFVVTANPVFDKEKRIKMVVTSVRDVTYLHHLQKQLRQVQQIYENNSDSSKLNEKEKGFIVYLSNQMSKLNEKIKQVAPFPTNVLITGDSGTGKEVLASMIHRLSSDKDKPFIKVNCAAIPPELFESEMFGYVSGSFTGARKEGKPGFFEQANSGTILLDEIGEIPLALQVKLLRVLQDKIVTRIGDTKPKNLSFRLICSTNQDLKKLILEKRFRQDLWYRINVIHLEIPPLSERKIDIPPLVEFFLEKFCSMYNLNKQILPEAMFSLENYSWPGNVRELKNTIEYLVVSTTTPFISPSDLPEIIKNNWNFEHPSSFETNSILMNNYNPESNNLKASLEQFEKDQILKAIGKSKSIRSAATLLGIDHASLIRKMNRLEINKPRN